MVTPVKSRGLSPIFSLAMFFMGSVMFPLGLVLSWLPWGLEILAGWLLFLGFLLILVPVGHSLVSWSRWPRRRLARLVEAILHWTLVTINLALIGHHLQSHSTRHDLSVDETSTLAPPTREVLARLETPVQLWAFMTPGHPMEPEIRALITEYQAASPRLTATMQDPDEQPANATRLGVRHPGVVVVESGSRVESTRLLDEAHISSALARLLKPPSRVGFVEGHDERAIGGLRMGDLSKLAEAMDVQNREAVAISLNQEIPAGLDILVLAGPRKDLSADEARRLETFVEAGGRVLLCLESLAFTFPNLEQVLANMHAVVPPGMVIDFERHAKNELGTLVLPVVKDLPLLGEQQPVVFPAARPVMVERNQDDIMSWILVASSTSSFYERHPEVGARFDEGEDLGGPVPVATAIEKRRKERPGRVVIVGNALWISNGFFDVMGNSDLFFGILRWFEDRDETLPIMGRGRARRLLYLTSDQMGLISLIACLGIPFLAMICGAYLVIARRI